MNEFKLSGKMGNKKEAYTSSGKCRTTFGINFYNGKDQNGKAVYEWINCKMNEKTSVPNKEYVIAEGWIAVETWKKDGKEYKNTVFIVKKLMIDEETKKKFGKSSSNIDEQWGENVVSEAPFDDAPFDDDEIKF